MARSLLRGLSRVLLASSVCALGALLARPARAQGYTAEPLVDGPGARPSDAPVLRLGTADDARRVVELDLPFPWRYYGRAVTGLAVSVDGWVRPHAGGDDAPVGAPPHLALPVLAGPLDGIIAASVRPAPDDGPVEDVAVAAWTSGDTPRRVFVIRWDRRTQGATSGAIVELRLHEHEERIEIVGRRSGDVAGLDEPAGARHVAALPQGGTRFTPRAPRWNDPGTGREHVPVTWRDVRRESTIPDGCTERCTYLAQGRHAFSVPDRAQFRFDERGRRRRVEGDVAARLRAEDAATFPSPAGDDAVASPHEGDAERWIRQVVDGKILLVPSGPAVNDGRPVRVWFRIVEYFDLDERGATLTDHHTWNVNRMLKAAFPPDDPRREIERYQAWKAMARSRLTVGKLFPTNAGARRAALGDAAPQFDSGRGREYVLWSGRIRGGDPPPDDASTPSLDAGWRRFALTEEDDARIVQRADAADLRFVADPNYVEGGYRYVIGAKDNPYGWVVGRTLPAPPLRDETLGP